MLLWASASYPGRTAGSRPLLFRRDKPRRRGWWHLWEEGLRTLEMLRWGGEEPDLEPEEPAGHSAHCLPAVETLPRCLTGKWSNKGTVGAPLQALQ